MTAEGLGGGAYRRRHRRLGHTPAAEASKGKRKDKDK